MRCSLCHAPVQGTDVTEPHLIRGGPVWPEWWCTGAGGPPVDDSDERRSGWRRQT